MGFMRMNAVIQMVADECSDLNGCELSWWTNCLQRVRSSATGKGGRTCRPTAQRRLAAGPVISGVLSHRPLFSVFECDMDGQARSQGKRR
jgi:hypothetical protein